MNILLCGNVNVDILMGKLERWPERGTETLLDAYELRIGGALGNMALALAALGADVEYHAGVGNDAFGRWLQSELASCGCRLERVDAPTAVTVGINHPDGQRTFLSTLGHLEAFDVRSLERAVDAAKPGDLLFLCGYFLMPPLRAATRTVLERARGRGLVTALDTGWPDERWTDGVREELGRVLEHCTYFLPNEMERRGYTGTDDLEEALRQIRGRSGCRTIVKLGADGAAFIDDRDELQHVAAQRVDVVDTTGAGDSFNAGVITALQRGLHLPEAIACGVRLATHAVGTFPRSYLAWEELQAGDERPAARDA